MKTENFSLANANAVYSQEAMVRTIRYDSGAAAGGVEARIRVRSILGGAYDVEMIPGRQIKLPEITRGLLITNLAAGGAAITGKITFGAGDVNDNSLVGSVDLTAATIANLIGAKYNVRPEANTAEYFSQAVLAANTADTVIAAGANTTGVLLQSAQIQMRLNGVLDPAAFIMHTAAPTTIAQGERALLTLPQMQDSGTNISIVAELKKDIYIPPGIGLYFLSVTAFAASNGNYRQARYRVLP